MNPDEIFNSATLEILEKVISDRAIRTNLTRKSHQWFFAIYFGRYMQYTTAPFQKEIFAITEDESTKTAVIVAFRGSAKSTIITLSYVIWAILGKQQKKFVVILSQTQRQARQHLINIKRELESNELLKDDLGPFEEQDDEWGSYSLVIPRYNARITAASTEQSIRGMRHGEYRPDLIICDDIEDLASAKTKEGRDKTYQWLTGDVIPAGDKNTRMIIAGNLLHEDSVIMRLKNAIEDGEFDGVLKQYPLIDDKGKILWPGKFNTIEDIEILKRTIGSETAWQREYLLRIVADIEQVVHPEWIHYYDELLHKDKLRYTATGIDLAISQKSTADYTAAVTANIYDYGRDLRIYILPNPVNERLTFPQTVDRFKLLSEIAGEGSRTHLYIEDVGYQRALVEHLIREGFQAEGIKLHGQDKRARIALTTSLIQNGQILFPRKGAESLIEQLVGFGVERYDDLADAFAILILKTMESDHTQANIYWLDCNCGAHEERGWKTIYQQGGGISGLSF